MESSTYATTSPQIRHDRQPHSISTPPSKHVTGATTQPGRDRTFGLDVGVALVVVLPFAVGLGVAGVAVVQQVTVGGVVRLALVIGGDRLTVQHRRLQISDTHKSQQK